MTSAQQNDQQPVDQTDEQQTDGQQPDEHLREEAKSYVDALPDETAAGRLVDDTGASADTTAWADEQARQRAALDGDNPR